MIPAAPFKVSKLMEAWEGLFQKGVIRYAEKECG